MSTGKTIQKQLNYARESKQREVAAKALATQFSAFGPRQKWLTRVAALIHVGALAWFLGLTAVVVELRREVRELRSRGGVIMMPAEIAGTSSSSAGTVER